MQAIANRTTSVASTKTVAEIQVMLGKAGAKQLLIAYDASEPIALSFTIDSNGKPISFRLPCNWLGVLKALRGQVPQRLLNHEHAKRVGWRLLRDWLRAQLPLVAAGATSLDEVMLPWAITGNGETVAQQLLYGNSQLLLPGPEAQE